MPGLSRMPWIALQKAAEMEYGNEIAILHGCNLNMLGRRDYRHYGSLTLPELEEMIEAEAARLGLKCSFFQTNHEGELVEKIQSLSGGIDAVIINPGAWTHYSYAIRDALELLEGLIVEVHLSDIENREDWRRRSVVREVCSHVISGKGPDGYIEAVQWLASELQAR